MKLKIGLIFLLSQTYNMSAMHNNVSEQVAWLDEETLIQEIKVTREAINNNVNSISTIATGRWMDPNEYLKILIAALQSMNYEELV